MHRSLGDDAEPAQSEPPRRVLDPRALAAEAERLVLRYVREVVEDLGFCPWAAQARHAGQVVVEVLRGTSPAPGDIADRMARLAERVQVVIGLLVLPEVRHHALAFRHLAAQVREHAGKSYGRGLAPWAIADFHPEGGSDMTSSDRAVAFIRRTPDPTFQLVRRDVLAELRVGHGEGTRFVDPSHIDPRRLASEAAPVSLRARIAANNWRTLKRLGPDALQARLSAIHQDRHSTYARLGLPPAPLAGNQPT